MKAHIFEADVAVCQTSCDRDGDEPTQTTPALHRTRYSGAHIRKMVQAALSVRQRCIDGAFDLGATAPGLPPVR